MPSNLVKWLCVTLIKLLRKDTEIEHVYQGHNFAIKLQSKSPIKSIIKSVNQIAIKTNNQNGFVLCI